MISILLTVRASSWPYHGVVGGGESTVLVGPVYGLSPVSLLPAKPEVETVIRGPVTGTTFVEGSSSGPVTIVSPGTPVISPQTTPSPAQSNPPVDKYKGIFREYVLREKKKFHSTNSMLIDSSSKGIDNGRSALTPRTFYRDT